MLRRRGIRVTSITEHADDTPTGKLMEAIIESVDEFFSENLAQEVKRGMREAASRGFFLASKAPYGYTQTPARIGSKFLLSGLLLSGLLRCGACGKPYTGQGAKSGQFGYYVCNTLLREGAGACDARYLNATRMEDGVVENIMARILNEQTITELVQLVAEKVDDIAEEHASQLSIVEADLPTTPEIKRYVTEFREFLQVSTVPERKALIRNFVRGIKVGGDEVSIRYTIPMPSDGASSD